MDLLFFAQLDRLTLPGLVRADVKLLQNRLSVTGDPGQFIGGQVVENAFRGLPIVAGHALRVWGLPDHHQDPFDRICKDRVEQMELLHVGKGADFGRQLALLLSWNCAFVVRGIGRSVKRQDQFPLSRGIYRGGRSKRLVKSPKIYGGVYAVVDGGVGSPAPFPGDDYDAGDRLGSVARRRDVFRFDREAVRLALEDANIEARPVWKPMHLQPVFRGARVRGGPVRAWSLPAERDGN